MRFKTSKVLAIGFVLALAATLAITPASGGSGGATQTRTKSVSVRDDRFSPKVASIAAGDKVVWRWKGENDHNVRFRKVPAGAKRPKGSPLQTDGRFARTFSKRGSYRYVCTLHEDLGMKGRVAVD